MFLYKLNGFLMKLFLIKLKYLLHILTLIIPTINIKDKFYIKEVLKILTKAFLNIILSFLLMVSNYT